MSDEIPIFVGGPPRHIEFITCLEGTPAHLLAKLVYSYTKFTVQLLVACCSDHIIDRPYKAFVEDEDTKQDILKQLNKYYTRAKERVAK